MNSSSNFINTNLSSGMSEFRWAPGTSNIAITRFSNSSIINCDSNVNNSIDTVGAADSSYVIYTICAIPSAHALPLTFMDHFSLINVIESNVYHFCLGIRSSGHTIPNVLILCSFYTHRNGINGMIFDMFDSLFCTHFFERNIHSCPITVISPIPSVSRKLPLQNLVVIIVFPYIHLISVDVCCYLLVYFFNHTLPG